MSKKSRPRSGAENDFGGNCKHYDCKLDSSSSTIIDDYCQPQSSSNDKRIDYLKKELFIKCSPWLFVNKLDPLTNVVSTFSRRVDSVFPENCEVTSVFSDFKNIQGCLFRQKLLGGDDTVYFAISSCYYNLDEAFEEDWDEHEGFVPKKMLLFINNKRFELKPTSPYKKYSKNDYVYYFLIERDVLYEIAVSCGDMTVRLYDQEGTCLEAILDHIQFDARWFYNKLYDNSAFAEEIRRKNQWAIAYEKKRKKREGVEVDNSSDEHSQVETTVTQESYDTVVDNNKSIILELFLAIIGVIVLLVVILSLIINNTENKEKTSIVEPIKKEMVTKAVAPVKKEEVQKVEGIDLDFHEVIKLVIEEYENSTLIEPKPVHNKTGMKLLYKINELNEAEETVFDYIYGINIEVKEQTIDGYTFPTVSATSDHACYLRYGDLYFNNIEDYHAFTNKIHDWGLKKYNDISGDLFRIPIRKMTISETSVAYDDYFYKVAYREEGKQENGWYLVSFATQW